MKRTRHLREMRERWIVTGTLELESPTSLSNGDEDASVALPLLTDPYDGRPLLTGASLAGALRSYVRRYYGDEGQAKAALLFGGAKQDPEGEQSPLIVEDALGVSAEVNIEIRDGVRIDPATRTAADGAKYDRQLLAAGTQFKIGFELLLTKELATKKEEVAEVLAVALHGLASGEIALGGRKRRGYGECKVIQWQVVQYDLTKTDGIKGWLGHGRAGFNNPIAPQVGGEIASLLNEKPALPTSHANELELMATFEVDGSVLIRAGFEQEKAPEMAHLTSWRINAEGKSELVPILSGTSLAGVIRAQAHRIARTVHGEVPAIDQTINDLFGYMPWQSHETQGKSTEAINKLRRASRVTVREVAIEGGQSLVQSRVAIDRFTGGALESALFEQQPHFGGRFTLRLHVRNPKPEEVGLLLLVLKDLWTGFTPIGGESSVGRGRLKGVEATLCYQDKTWRLEQTGKKLHIAEGELSELEGFVTQFVGGVK